MLADMQPHKPPGGGLEGFKVDVLFKYLQGWGIKSKYSQGVNLRILFASLFVCMFCSVNMPLECQDAFVLHLLRKG